MQDPALERVERGAAETLGDVGRAVVAGELRRERAAALLRLQRIGVHVVDASPAQVSTELVNRYLEIKRRELV